MRRKENQFNSIPERRIWEQCNIQQKHENVFCESVNQLFKSILYYAQTFLYRRLQFAVLLHIEDIHRKNFMKKLSNGVEQKHRNQKNRLNIEH